MVWRSSSDLSTLLLHLLLCNLRLIFECAKTDPSEQSFDAVRKEIAQIQFLCSEMEPLWRSISAKSQRDIWKRKAEQVAEEAESLKASLDKYNLRHQWRMQEARERAELIERSNGDSSHVLRIFGYEAQAMQSARRKKPWQRVWPFCLNIVSKGIV
ncbi:Membrin-12 [Capsicum chinense]|nr:Membrin-12 [Capsicum chinense]